MDQVEIGGADRQGLAKAFAVARPELAVDVTGTDGPVHRGPVLVGPIVLVRGDDDAERFAATSRAVDLDERDVVAPGEDADPVGGDELAACGAVDAVGERIEIVARIHRPQV